MYLDKKKCCFLEWSWSTGWNSKFLILQNIEGIRTSTDGESFCNFYLWISVKFNRDIANGFEISRVNNIDDEATMETTITNQEHEEPVTTELEIWFNPIYIGLWNYWFLPRGGDFTPPTDSLLAKPRIHENWCHFTHIKY